MKFLDLQTIISYLGLIPLVLLLLIFNYSNYLSIHFFKDFAIFYLIIIFSFIGAMRWSFSGDSNFYQIIFGFMPSLMSTIFIIFYLLGLNRNVILLLISLSFILQLASDYFLYKINQREKMFFFKIRIPITTIIVLINFYFITV